MVTHVVLFQLRDASEASSAATAAVLMEMDGKIPCLESIEVGVDVVHSERSYDLALITRFKDWSGLETYRVHPVHAQVLTHLQRVVAKSVVVDFES
jgi:hypothetical protein